MNGSDLIAALDLYAGSRVDQRVPKKLLLENGAPTAADRRYINEGIEALQWVAVLKPVLMLAENGERPGLFVAHKRWSQGEAGKTVLDGEVVAVDSGAASVLRR